MNKADQDKGSQPETDAAMSSDNSTVDAIQQVDEKSADLKTTAELTAQSSAAKSSGAKTSSNGGLWLLVLLLVGAVSGLGYYGWQLLLQQQLATEQLQQQLRDANTLSKQQQASTNKLQQQLAEVNQQQANNSQYQQQLSVVQTQLDSQSQRLRSMTTTNREDWLLAEAEYLLRLANQRMQMERGTEGAIALVEAADLILKEIDHADLFGVREAIANDLLALKLAPSVDYSGIYLRLAALSQALESVSFISLEFKAGTTEGSPLPSQPSVATNTDQEGWQAGLVKKFPASLVTFVFPCSCTAS